MVGLAGCRLLIVLIIRTNVRESPNSFGGTMKRQWAFLMLAFVILLSHRAALGQVSAAEAQLNGSVRDQTGSVIVKAQVALRNVDNNQLYKVASNGIGFYILTNVPPGSYDLTVESQGFARYEQKGIVLRVAQVATIDVTLKVAGANQEVVVNTEAPTIEPTRTEVSQVVETQQIQALPISGRLFTDFALLSPGVTTGRISLQSTFTDPSVTRISFGEQRDLNNSVTVDGADNINTATGSQRATPSQEAVSEFRVVNNSFAAEYGRALGGIVNIVTKSGTNDIHGSVYEYFMNNKLNAKPLLTEPSFQTFRQNQFGATLGGPLRKDKTFYFLNYEGQRRGQSPSFPGLLVANLPAINELKTSLGIAPENLNVLKTADVDNGFIKVDHQLSEKNRLSARYSIQDATNLNMLVGETLDGGGVGAPSSGRNGSLRDQDLVGTLTTTLSENKVNSVLLQWARRNYGFAGVTCWCQAKRGGDQHPVRRLWSAWWPRAWLRSSGARRLARALSILTRLRLRFPQPGTTPSCLRRRQTFLFTSITATSAFLPRTNT